MRNEGPSFRFLFWGGIRKGSILLIEMRGEPSVRTALVGRRKIVVSF